MCAGLQVLDSVSVLAGAGKIALDSTGLGSGDRYMQEGVLGVRRGHFWGEMGVDWTKDGRDQQQQLMSYPKPHF